MLPTISTPALVLLLPGIVYLALSPRFAPWLYRTKIFKQKTNSPCDLELLAKFAHPDKTQHFFPTVDKRRLHAWFFRQKDSPDVVLYCLGRTNSISDCLEQVSVLLRAGYSVFIFEYRGFGKSEGHRKRHPTVRSICEDGVAAFDFVVNNLGYDGSSQVTVYGASLGVGVAVYIMTQRRMRGLILQSGFASLKLMGEHAFKALKVYPVWLYPRLRMDSEKSLRAGHPDLLILHGELDEIVPFSHAERLFASAISPNKRLVPLPHSLHRCLWQTDPDLYADSISAFRNSLHQREVSIA